ncbi:HAD-like domain-containing protein [Russula brevipes]|nr:HAD-like domain-containing protein [Russula brevipes]
MPTITVDAVLFDMDGTLVDSTPAVLAAWDQFGREYGFDGAAAAHDTHGRRLAETLGELCNLEAPEQVAAAAERFEEAVVAGDLIALPDRRGSLPSARGWTIVTSATTVYARQALARADVPVPVAGYVTSNDVRRGKPQPDPYLAGAERVGADPKKCLVVEDAPSGLLAGRAAGARTLAVCTSHTRDEIIASGASPDFFVDDLTKVSARWADGKVVVDIDDSL